MEAFTALALRASTPHTTRALTEAADRWALEVVPLPAAVAHVMTVPSPGLAWRLPVGMATALHASGTTLRLTAPSADWFAGLPSSVTGRTLTVITAGRLASQALPEGPLGMIKLAEAKLRRFAATRVSGWREAAALVAAADLPPKTRLLGADRYLPCASEYRAFCIGRDVVTVSAYLVEDDPWSPTLHQHRASFHTEAAAWLSDVLRDLPAERVPPASVLDIAKVQGGDFVVLEANTTWGAGLYGCDPDLVLHAVLAANLPADDRWTWRPDPG